MKNFFRSIKTKTKFGILHFLQILNTKFNWDWFIGCWRWQWNIGQEKKGVWRKNSIMISFTISAVQQTLSQWSILFLHLSVHRARASLNTLRSYSSQNIGFVSLAVHRVRAFLSTCDLFVWCPNISQFTVCIYISIQCVRTPLNIPCSCISQYIMFVHLQYTAFVPLSIYCVNTSLNISCSCISQYIVSVHRSIYVLLILLSI